MAAYRAGLIAVPLFVLFGPDAIEYRLADSGAVALDHRRAPTGPRWPRSATGCPTCARSSWSTAAGVDGTLDYADELGAAADRVRDRRHAADDPAIIIYTSGTTGPPKGALHAHRFLLGHLPGVLLPQEFPPQPGDLFWTPADWAWIGGLYDVLFPAWHWGLPVLAHRARKFDPERALDLMARHAVRNVFLPPTALKLIRRSGARPGPDLAPAVGGQRRRDARRRSSSTGAASPRRRRSTSSTARPSATSSSRTSTSIMPIRPGSMGRAGARSRGRDHRRRRGAVAARRRSGEIAVRRPDPVMFLGYWNRPEATLAKFSGDWLRTGDRASMDDDGYVWYQARNDDVITSGGYRIGPGEIEDCLLRHPAVAMVAVVGIPDPDRTEIVKAFVVPAPGVDAIATALTAELQAFVRERLAAHEYPRAIDYVAELPLTATGKVMRRELRALG